jgi:hypothetical protein
MFATLFGSLVAFWKALTQPVKYVSDEETRYLNGSVDIYDLEHRQRMIDRGLFHQKMMR